MRRLIDSNELIKRIDIGHLRNPNELCFSEMDVVNMLLHAPTAYDVNAVVKKLEDYLFDKYCIEGDFKIYEIVKGGNIC